MAFFIAANTGVGAFEIYPFAIPHLTTLCFVIVCCAYAAFQHRHWLVVGSLIAFGLAGTLLTVSYAGSKWPGGNDGPGLAWVFIIGGFSALNAICAIVVIISLVREKFWPSYVRHDRD